MISAKCFSVRIILFQWRAAGSFQVHLISLLPLVKMVQSEFGIQIIMQWLRVALHQWTRQQEELVEYTLTVQSSLMKSSLVGGLMDASELIELTIASYFGRLKMHTRAELQLFASLQILSSLSPVECKEKSVCGRSDQENLSLTWKNTLNELPKSNFSRMTNIYLHAQETNQSYVGIWKPKKEYLLNNSVWEELMASELHQQIIISSSALAKRERFHIGISERQMQRRSSRAVHTKEKQMN